MNILLFFLNHHPGEHSYIIHKVDKGKVDLHVKLSAFHRKWEEIRSVMAGILDEDMILPKPGKRDRSFKVSLDVPVLNPYRPFVEDEIEKVHNCISALVRLHEWHNRHADIFSVMEKEYSL